MECTFSCAACLAFVSLKMLQPHKASSSCRYDEGNSNQDSCLSVKEGSFQPENWKLYFACSVQEVRLDDMGSTPCGNPGDDLSKRLLLGCYLQLGPLGKWRHGEQKFGAALDLMESLAIGWVAIGRCWGCYSDSRTFLMSPKFRLLGVILILI